MEEELIFIKLCKLSLHHKRATLYIRDKILDRYVDKDVLVKVFVIKDKDNEMMEG